MMSESEHKDRNMAYEKLLVVDDEADLLAELVPLLKRSGFEVQTASDGAQALQRVHRQQPDLIVLDVIMPQMDGREVLRSLRQEGNWVPVILLTRVGSPSERAFSLQEGADDYLNKPFEPIELIARIQAVLRRTRHGKLSLSSYQKLVAGDLALDRQKRQAQLGSKSILLTARAFGVLEYLMLHPQEVLTREQLLDQVWGWSYPVGTRAVDMRITEIRKALQDDAEHPQFIETVTGQGYCFLVETRGQKA